MAKTNAANERIKRDYFRYLKDALGRDEATIDRVAKSLARFEDSTRRRDFRKFHREQAIAFKQKLAEARSARTDARLSKATVLATLRDLKAFFAWASREPGYKSHIAYCDADYFTLAERDTAIARARREKTVPSPEQVRHVLDTMPIGSPLERRDRALIAFTAITAARVNALASFRLGNVDMAKGMVAHDARTVNTKFGKTFPTYFMPVVEGAQDIVADWVRELRENHLFAPTDPLFPATAMGVGEDGGFQPTGLARHNWASTGPIRDAFRRAFERAGLPYFNPHSFRDMAVRHAMTLDLGPEEMKAWSQNLGHSDVLTTFTSYGQVPTHRQAELIREAKTRHAPLENLDKVRLLETMLDDLKSRTGAA